jgi:DNA-binding CsgD family transcriptional regulator
MIIEEEPHFKHYGILRKSGRYPWGSGGDIPQRSKSFLDYVALLRKQGVSEANIAKGVDMTTTELRAAKTIARNQAKQADIAFATRLAEKQYSNMEIGRRMGIPESSVRNLLRPSEQLKADQLMTISNMLKEQVAEKTYVDVGKGVERQLGISKEKLDTALAILKEDGDYFVTNVQTPTAGSKNLTTIRVLAPPGSDYKQVKANLDSIQQIQSFSQDGGSSFFKILPPLSLDSARVGINYAADGGADADGVIYVRPGIPDVSLGKDRYAQVRIAVDGTHYLKGMAMYKEDLPKGKDVVFNTNKDDSGNKLDAMKPLKRDKETGEVDKTNPFGSIVRQLTTRDADGNEKLTSAMNIVNAESDWETWSKTLSSQMLSKQSPKLAKEQLNMTYERRVNALKEIQGLTNPSVRKKLLEAYADEADSAAIHLKAAALPRQRNQVILPINSLKDTEVYAPNFRNGERLVLIRHPHAGPFEIPELRVNNRNPEGKSLIGQATAAIGINSNVAKRLSGADFDGDTVLAIPNDRDSVKTAPSLLGLKDFEPQKAYPGYPGMPKMSTKAKGLQMGLISNLITDMTIQRASSQEIAAAVRHSMVVIDAEKHNLNYRQSAKDNNIAHLKEKYQGSARGGASTLISRAGAEKRGLPERRLRPMSEGGPIDKATGKLVYVNKPGYVNKAGELVQPKAKYKLLDLTDDAHTLSSGTAIEKVYADHSNKLRDLANLARKEAVFTKPNPRYSSAAKVYETEVKSLDAKLNRALLNAPLERQAQLIANKTISAKKASNPDMDDAELKKLTYLAIAEARARTGAGKEKIVITEKEWAAIQAGALAPTKLDSILTHADLDSVKDLAAPRVEIKMTSAKETRARSMYALGYTQSEIADQLGVSLTTLKTAFLGGMD